MVAKHRVIEVVESFADEVDLEELIYRLYLQEKLAEAEKDIAAGRTVTTDELRARSKTWQR
jgi:hypothetical protein